MPVHNRTNLRPLGLKLPVLDTMCKRIGVQWACGCCWVAWDRSSCKKTCSHTEANRCCRCTEAPPFPWEAELTDREKDNLSFLKVRWCYTLACCEALRQKQQETEHDIKRLSDQFKDIRTRSKYKVQEEDSEAERKIKRDNLEAELANPNKALLEARNILAECVHLDLGNIGSCANKRASICPGPNDDPSEFPKVRRHVILYPQFLKGCSPPVALIMQENTKKSWERATEISKGQFCDHKYRKLSGYIERAAAL